MKKVVMLINDTTYAYNLRGAIIERLVKEGFKVVVVGTLLKHQDKLIEIGAQIIGVETGRHGKNPFSDLLLLFKYINILKNEKPNVVLTYNIKPNVYGGLACQILRIPYLPNITGLGTPLECPGLLQKLTIKLYKYGVAGARCVFFQNQDNKQFFITHNMLNKGLETKVLPGSGVDLNRFHLLPWSEDNSIHFLFAARIMKEKGIDLFLAAARNFASEKVVFDICGACDDKKYLDILSNEKSVHYHGQQNDMILFYQSCSCFLYPSYYPEGMSNVLLEASASGRPVITTNRPGCGEIVDDGITGYKFDKNDTKKMFTVIEKFIKMPKEERMIMGVRGRNKIEASFDRAIVVNTYLDTINKIV